MDHIGLRVLFAFPLAVLFMVLSDEWSVGGLVVGYGVGFIAMMLTGDIPYRLKWWRVPFQVILLALYALRLSWDIIRSSVDVARRVLDPDLPINPGELTIPTHDERRDVLLAALSAHAITVTPGEMVMDFEEVDGEPAMHVHTLDVEASKETMEPKQTRRVSLLRRAIGEAEE